MIYYSYHSDIAASFNSEMIVEKFLEKVDKTWCEVAKELKDLTKQNVPQSTGSPMNMNSLVYQKKQMNYKGKS